MAIRKHIKGIDGLRAISALLVILFHLEIRGFAMGWAGVQFFFVISGYLITKILTQSRDEHQGNMHQYLKVFYLRRTLRIFPLYYLYLIVAILVAIVVHRPFNDSWHYFLYIQNFTLGMNRFSTQLVLGHTWSLAVEEQFYLLWPLLVWYTPPKYLPKLPIVLITLSITSRLLILNITQNQYLHFSTLFSNLDTLALGSLLAVYADHPRYISFRFPVFIISLLFLIISIHSIGYSNLWTPTQWTFTRFGPYFLTIVGFFFFALMLVLLHAPAFLLDWLDSPPLAFVGKISYGVYLYHSIAIIVVHKAVFRLLGLTSGLLTDFIIAVASIALTIFVSWLSYRYFEIKFLRLKSKVPI